MTTQGSMLGTKKHFLLTTGRSYLTLNWARLLHARGHRVSIIDTMTHYICQYSNAVASHYTVPSPKQNAEAYINTLLTICNEQHVDYCLPMFEDALWLAPYRKQFLPQCELLCPDLQCLMLLHNKWQFNQWLVQQGLCAPNTQLITHTEQLKQLDSNKRYILKKIYTHAAQSIYIVDRQQNYPTNLSHNPNNPWIAQTFIEGSKYCAYSIARNGNIQAASVYPVSFAIDSNSCVYFEAIEKPEIINWMQRVIKFFNYTGQIAFDFIQDPQGNLYPIECNPRGTSGIHLFSAEQALDQALMGTTPQCITPPLGQTKQILMGMLLYGHRTPVQERRGRRYWRTLLGTADVVIDRQDPCPGWMQTLLAFFHTIAAWKNGLTLTAAFYDDLVWTDYNNPGLNIPQSHRLRSQPPIPVIEPESP